MTTVSNVLRAVAVSPDGKHVYWSGENNSVFVDDYLLATFARDSTSGLLAILNRDGSTGRLTMGERFQSWKGRLRHDLS